MTASASFSARGNWIHFRHLTRNPVERLDSAIFSALTSLQVLWVASNEEVTLCPGERLAVPRTHLDKWIRHPHLKIHGRRNVLIFFRHINEMQLSSLDEDIFVRNGELHTLWVYNIFFCTITCYLEGSSFQHVQNASLIWYSNSFHCKVNGIYDVSCGRWNSWNYYWAFVLVVICRFLDANSLSFLPTLLFQQLSKIATL